MALTTRAAILQALRRPLSGQEIVSQVAARSRGRVRLHYGSVHPALRRLERERLVRSWLQRGSRGRPRRNYELTVTGILEAERIRDDLRSLIAPLPLPPNPRTPLQMASGIRGCEEISLLARAFRQAGVQE